MTQGRSFFSMNRFPKKDRWPDWKGTLEISPEMLKQLIALAKEGKPIKAQLSAWEKNGSKGPFLSGEMSEYKEREGPARQEEKPAPSRNQGATMALDDELDIPFSPEWR